MSRFTSVCYPPVTMFSRKNMKTVKCQVWLWNVTMENTQITKSVLWFQFWYTKFLKWQNGRAKTGNTFLHHVDSRLLKTAPCQKRLYVEFSSKIVTIKSNSTTRTMLSGTFTIVGLLILTTCVNPYYLTLKQVKMDPQKNARHPSHPSPSPSSVVVPQVTQQRNHLAPLSRDRILDLPHLQPTSRKSTLTGNFFDKVNGPRKIIKEMSES